MPDPLILYSTITKLAYNVAQTYYGGVHYVWCSPQLGTDRLTFSNPPSSDPICIYWRYYKDISRRDSHSDIIKQNRLGLTRGATFQEQAGIIDATKRKLITGMARKAALDDFVPLLLVMPYERVRHLAEPANLTNRAGVTSQEYIIKQLPRDCFDVLELKER